MRKPEKKAKTGWLNIAVDYGPLIVFLAVYKLATPEGDAPLGQIAAVVKGTIAFMIAAVIALALSKWKFGKVSPMLMLSTALIVGFGALTIWLRDESFIQFKPTAIYLLFGVLLIGGWLRGKALLQVLLEAVFEGVDRRAHRQRLHREVPSTAANAVNQRSSVNRPPVSISSPARAPRTAVAVSAGSPPSSRPTWSPSTNGANSHDT